MAKQEFIKGVQNLLYRIGLEVTNEAKKVAPVVTSNLKNDIGVFTDNLSQGIIEVGNSKIAPYSKYVYYGTKPHTIVPKKKKALKTPHGYYKKVKHPGTKPNPYLEIGLENYLRGGGFERAVDESKLDEAIVKDLKLDELAKKWS